MCAFSSDAGQGSPLEWRFSSALRESSRRRRTAACRRGRGADRARSPRRDRAFAREPAGRRETEETKRRTENKNRTERPRARVSGSAVYMPFSVSVNSRVEALFSRLPLTVWLCPVKQGVGCREACQPSIHGLSLVSAVGND